MLGDRVQISRKARKEKEGSIAVFSHYVASPLLRGFIRLRSCRATDGGRAGRLAGLDTGWHPSLEGPDIHLPWGLQMGDALILLGAHKQRFTLSLCHLRGWGLLLNEPSPESRLGWQHGSGCPSASIKAGGMSSD